MLNAGNLALISFARLHGDHDGQIFALAVMAVAASEVVVGLGLIVAIARKRLDLDVDRLQGAARMIAGAWICLLAPLAGALLITCSGPSISRRTAAWLSTLSVFAAFGGAVAAFVGLLGREHEEREAVTTAWTWLSAGNFDVGLSLLVDPLSVTMMLIVSGVGGLIVLYSIGYMDGDHEERRYFAYMSLFVFSMLLLVQGGNLLLLLAGWGLVGLASYLLIGFWHERPRGGRGREEGVRDERLRRRDDGARVLRAHLADGHARLRGGVRGLGRPVADARQPRRARPARRRGRQVGPDPAAHVAPGRDGRPHAGLRPHPRGDDGHRGRLPDRARAPDLRARALDLRSRCRARRDHAPRRRPGRARADRHQARDRLLDDVADRLHVPRRRARRVRERDVPPDDARLLQGAALHGRRARDPPPRERAGHPEDGRPPAGDAEDVHRVPDRLARARRHPAALGLLLEGLDPRLGAARPAATGSCSSRRALPARC